MSEGHREYRQVRDREEHRRDWSRGGRQGEEGRLRGEEERQGVGGGSVRVRRLRNMSPSGSDLTRRMHRRTREEIEEI